MRLSFQVLNNNKAVCAICTLSNSSSFLLRLRVRAIPGQTASQLKMSDKKQTVDLGLLEEDDEFEEFPAEDWTGLDEDEDAHVWEDNWDDDNVEDDFSNQLRAELEKHGYKMETS
uniref:26S proteasome complex subunit SEM1 n=1 Tax=Labrus bergylta TaxID=56723 RepID=A0A3Q3EG79_9LABR